MRVLFLADAVFEDLPGGSRVAARQLARYLTEAGHEVTFLVGRQTPDAPADERKPGIGRIVRYAGAGQGSTFVRNGQAACARLWADQPFDLVHTHFAYAAVGPLAAIPPAVPHVRTFHGPWEQEGWLEDTHQGGSLRLAKATIKKLFRYQIEQRNLRRSSRVLTLSRCFQQLVTTRYHLAPERVTVIPGGTDLARFQPTDDKAACRRTLDLPPDRQILLSIRRLAPRMGLENLVAAVALLVARHPNILLLIGGKGPEQTRLDSQVRALHLEEHVRLVGFIADDLLATYYQSADLFVLPTLALEGFGLVTTEALACGLPVIGTNVGATPEILGGLDPRLIAPDVTPAALADTIHCYLSEDWNAALTPAHLHQYVRQHYTWEQHGRQTEAVYREVLRGANLK